MTTIHSRISIHNPNVKPLDVRKLQTFEITNAREDANQNLVNVLESSGDHQILRESPAYEELQKSEQARTEFLAQRIAQEGNVAERMGRASGDTVYPSSNQTASKSSSIDSTDQTADSKLETIANKYDVRNLSGYERVAMAEELRDNHLISSGTMMTILAPLSMNENMSQKTDYLSTAKLSFEYASKMGGSEEQLKSQKQRLEILERLERIHKKTELYTA
ncbi:MAG: hypothetical protein P1V34_16380 [Alphaproteobacteria bacterium]|nr:hypothetical protein [Alphaproteobacteria bacterium]